MGDIYLPIGTVIQKLELRQGDMLVLRTKKSVSAQQVKAIGGMIQQACVYVGLKPIPPILHLGPDLELVVICKGDVPADLPTLSEGDDAELS